MRKQFYDLIGDIHGHHDKLTILLTKLGYKRCGDGYHHPECRKVIFLGDYIDRGPKVPEVLATVKSMVDAGDALAIMGNHEYNAICYHTPDNNGGWLRQPRPDRDFGLRATLKQFARREDEWQEWLVWMKRLPLFLELDGLRVVHACWDDKAIRQLADKALADDEFLRASAERDTPLNSALKTVLKGPEMNLPQGSIYHDKDGFAQGKVRVRWWDVPERTSVSKIAMPEPFDIPGDAPCDELRRLPNYPVEDPPVFFGHYWLPAHQARKPLRHNIACLDYSAAREGPMVAYRWGGERRLSPSHFVISYAGRALSD